MKNILLILLFAPIICVGQSQDNKRFFYSESQHELLKSMGKIPASVDGYTYTEWTANADTWFERWQDGYEVICNACEIKVFDKNGVIYDPYLRVSFGTNDLDQITKQTTVKLNKEAIRQAITSTWVAHEGTAIDVRCVCDFAQVNDCIVFWYEDGNQIGSFRFKSDAECKEQFKILLKHLDAFILK